MKISFTSMILCVAVTFAVTDGSPSARRRSGYEESIFEDDVTLDGDRGGYSEFDERVQQGIRGTRYGSGDYRRTGTYQDSAGYQSGDEYRRDGLYQDIGHGQSTRDEDLSVSAQGWQQGRLYGNGGYRKDEEYQGGDEYRSGRGYQDNQYLDNVRYQGHGGGHQNGGCEDSSTSNMDWRPYRNEGEVRDGNRHGNRGHRGYQGVGGYQYGGGNQGGTGYQDTYQDRTGDVHSDDESDESYRSGRSGHGGYRELGGYRGSNGREYSGGDKYQSGYRRAEEYQGAGSPDDETYRGRAGYRGRSDRDGDRLQQEHSSSAEDSGEQDYQPRRTSGRTLTNIGNGLKNQNAVYTYRY